jgi:ATP/ADP translocase
MSNAGDFARLVIETVKHESAAEVERWTDKDRALVFKVGRAAFALQTKELATGKIDSEARADLSAQMQNIAVAIGASGANIITRALDSLLQRSGQMAAGIGKGLLKLIGG